MRRIKLNTFRSKNADYFARESCLFDRGLRIGTRRRSPACSDRTRKNRKISFSAGPLSRRNLELKVSRDQGGSWTLAETVHPGPAAYSDLAQLDRRTVGCLYEAGEKSPYEGIFFRAVAISR
jgi:hypothetical protein